MCHMKEVSINKMDTPGLRPYPHDKLDYHVTLSWSQVWISIFFVYQTSVYDVHLDLMPCTALDFIFIWIPQLIHGSDKFLAFVMLSEFTNCLENNLDCGILK